MDVFLSRLKNEPALITGLLLAVFNLFAVDPKTSSSIITIVSGVLPLLLAVVVRQSVDGPLTQQKNRETKKVLAEAVNQVETARATGAPVRVAKEVRQLAKQELNQPEPEVRWIGDVEP